MAERGRPSKYNDQTAKQAAKLCTLGATDQDLADFFEVDVRTISNWKVTHEDFFQALVTNKPGYDDAIERSLAMRAIGYSHPETKINVVDGQIVETTVLKHYPPDAKACAVWLFNRRGEKWHPQPVSADDDIKAEPQQVIITVVDASKKKA